MRLSGLGVSPGIGIGKALVLGRGARDFRFRIPASWGGQLVVIWALGAAAPNGSPLDLQVESAILRLGGKQVDCLTFLSSGNPIP